MKKSHAKTINSKYQSPRWNEELELPDGSKSVSDIQIYFNYIIKTYKTVTDNSPIRKYVNKIENRTTYEIKTGFYLEFLTLETKKLLGSTKSKITKNEKGENVLHLETTEIVLVYCNIVNNDYQLGSRALNTFFPNKSLRQKWDIEPTNFIFLKTFNSEFSYTEVWFMNQDFKPLEMRGKINITLVIN